MGSFPNVRHLALLKLLYVGMQGNVADGRRIVNFLTLAIASIAVWVGSVLVDRLPGRRVRQDAT